MVKTVCKKSGGSAELEKQDPLVAKMIKLEMRIGELLIYKMRRDG